MVGAHWRKIEESSVVQLYLEVASVSPGCWASGSTKRIQGWASARNGNMLVRIRQSAMVAFWSIQGKTPNGEAKRNSQFNQKRVKGAKDLLLPSSPHALASASAAESL